MKMRIFRTPSLAERVPNDHTVEQLSDGPPFERAPTVPAAPCKEFIKRLREARLRKVASYRPSPLPAQIADVSGCNPERPPRPSRMLPRPHGPTTPRPPGPERSLPLLLLHPGPLGPH